MFPNHPATPNRTGNYNRGVGQDQPKAIAPYPEDISGFYSKPRARRDHHQQADCSSITASQISRLGNLGLAKVSLPVRSAVMVTEFRTLHHHTVKLSFISHLSLCDCASQPSSRQL